MSTDQSAGRKRLLRLALVLLLAVAVIVTVAILATHNSRQQPAEPSSSAPPPPGDAVLAVKIDNVAQARPQTGLATADTVYVEPVEGGLTRLLAIFRGG